MVAKKRPSKRTTLQKKYKIQKRTKQHHKKLRQGKLVGPGGPTLKKKQRDHIPNAWPYKDQLLRDIALAKDKMEEVKQRKLEQRSIEQSRSSHLKMLDAMRRTGGGDMEMDDESDNEEGEYQELRQEQQGNDPSLNGNLYNAHTSLHAYL
jgi:hypothetical protein